MSKKDLLNQFAKSTIRFNEAISFLASPEVQALKNNYVDLWITDSGGKRIRVSELLSRGSRLILVGDPGSGKTTALKHLAVHQSEQYLAKETDALPIYFALRHYHTTDWQDLFNFVDLDPDVIGHTPLLFLLDGLDEVPVDQRSSVAKMILQLGASYPSSQIVLASRPAGLSPLMPEEFRFYHLESLDTSQTREFIFKLTDDKVKIHEFETILDSARFLEGLSHNPLLIRLLWDVYRQEARLPSIRADLYQSICDFLLSSWDSYRGVLKRQAQLDVYSVHKILETMAINAFEGSMHLIPISDLRAEVSRYFESKGYSIYLVDWVINQLLSSGILIRQDSESFSFIHLTFMEFYAAKWLINASSSNYGIRGK